MLAVGYSYSNEHSTYFHILFFLVFIYDSSISWARLTRSLRSFVVSVFHRGARMQFQKGKMVENGGKYGVSAK